MFNKKNPMRYFSGSTFARLPLYKLAAGGTAVVLTASIGLGAFAASVGPLSAPEPSPTPDASASPSPTPSKSAKEDDAESEKTPLLGVAATITLTDAKGNATDYELDTETGTALAEDVTPGDYTLAVQPIEGYTQPEAQTVTVKEKVVYKADVKAVKEKIVQASQVNESAEDSGVSNAGSAPIVNEVTDTVTYADSARTETGSKTSYTAKLSSSGHLLLADGTDFAWKCNEHCLLLVGYDEENYWFNDPWHDHGVCPQPKQLVEDCHAAQGMFAVTLRPKGEV